MAVFITHQQNKFNYDGAMAFGPLEVVSTRVYSFAPGNAVNDGIIAGIRSAAARFNPAEDFILPSGSAIMTALFITALAARGVHRPRLLMWSTADSMYSVGHLDILPLLKD